MEENEDLFRKEKLDTPLKGSKNNNALGADSLVKYGCCEVTDKLLKIMNEIFEKGNVPSDSRKLQLNTLIALHEERYSFKKRIV